MRISFPGPRRRGILLALGTALVIILVLASLPSLRPRGPGPADLILSASLSPADEAALRSLLPRFSSMHGGISVTLRNENQANPLGADLMIGPAHLFPVASEGVREDIRYSLLPWSGAVWSLAARKEALDRASASLPAEVEALRQGKASPEEFRRLLDFFTAEGKAPITLGNSHHWPYLLWLQHWVAALSGPESARAIPLRPGEDPEAGQDPYAALRPAMAELRAWREAGYFNADAWKEGWARGLLPLAQGEAVFALVSDEYLAPITPEARKSLLFLPFPRRTEDGPWTIGSATYLGLLRGRTAPEAGELLLRFLSSPGITEELSRLTGKPYFSWDPKSGKVPEVIPAWLEAAATQEFDALSRAALGK
jgi:hypothetical protein